VVSVCGACMSVQFTILGNPIPKARPRFSGHAYTPKSTRDWTEVCQQEAWLAMRGQALLEGNLRLELFFYRSNKRHADWENLAKLVCDAMNEVVYDDDKQIKESHVWVNVDRENPRTEVFVECLGNQSILLYLRDLIVRITKKLK